MGDVVFIASNDLGILFIQVSCLIVNSPGASIHPLLVLQQQYDNTPTLQYVSGTKINSTACTLCWLLLTNHKAYLSWNTSFHVHSHHSQGLPYLLLTPCVGL